MTDAKIISGLNPVCNEEAVRLVKLLKFTVPKNRGVRAIFHKNLTIHFRLPKEKPIAKIPIIQPTAKAEPVHFDTKNNTTQQAINYTIIPADKTKSIEKSPDEEEQNGGGYNYTISW